MSTRISRKTQARQIQLAAQIQADDRATYVLILAAEQTRSANGFLAAYVLTMLGFGFSAYLTYREVFTIHAICSWCVSSAIVFTLLATVGTLRALRLDRSFRAAAAQTT